MTVSSSTHFQKMVSTTPTWQQEYGVYQRDSASYQRVPCIWQEKGEEGAPGKQHVYHAAIDVRTGDLYLDCRRRKIALKHACLLVVRPIHLCIKTLWHASIIGPLALEIFACIKKRQTIKDLARHTLQSLADIVRTPLYAVAMMLVHLAGLILGALAPNTLYHTRFAAGYLERSLLRFDKYSRWMLSPCFSPLWHLSKAKAWKRNRETGRWERQFFTTPHQNLAFFAQLQVDFRRGHQALFNDSCHLLPKEVTYVSAAAKPVVPSATKPTAPHVAVATFAPAVESVHVQPLDLEPSAEATPAATAAFVSQGAPGVDRVYAQVPSEPISPLNVSPLIASSSVLPALTLEVGRDKLGPTAFQGAQKASLSPLTAG